MSTCRSCGAEVMFVPSAKTGRPMILDATAEKRVVLIPAADVVRYASEALGLFYGRVQDVYTDHHATCPAAKDWKDKSRKDAPAGPTPERPAGPATSSEAAGPAGANVREGSLPEPRVEATHGSVNRSGTHPSLSDPAGAVLRTSTARAVGGDDTPENLSGDAGSNPAPRSEPHRVAIEPRSVYLRWASCSCGWTGPNRWTDQQAEADARRHEETEAGGAP